MSTNQIISKVWSFCNTLRDDGVGYDDYLEQLTYLLFLKMADEFSKPPYNSTITIPSVFDGKPACQDTWTKEVWIYDYRTNVHHTLKKNPLKFSDLEDFIKCYYPENRHKRKETWSAEPDAKKKTGPEGRWRKFTYDEIMVRDKTSLDITWLRDKSLADMDNLPDPDVLAEEIVENLESALDGFRNIIAQLKAR